MEDETVTEHDRQSASRTSRSMDKRSDAMPQTDSTVVALVAVFSLKIDLPPPFKGDRNESFTSWSHCFDVAVQAMSAPDRPFWSDVCRTGTVYLRQ